MVRAEPLIYTGSVAGTVHGGPQRKRPQVSSLKTHTDAVTSIIELPNLKLIVSASLDHNVVVWDLDDHRVGSASRKRRECCIWSTRTSTR